MPEKEKKISRLWQELKRRRVIHVITVYASAALVFIELVINLTEPLNLPTRMPTIVIIVLAIGLPLAIILSWFYDLTSEGVEKTKPLSEIPEGKKTVVPNAWKIATYASLVVISGLIVLNVLGGSKKLRAGDIQSLVILPFENFTGDDRVDWLVEGMQAQLIGDVQRISGVDVLNRTSSNAYKNADKGVQEIASELDTDAVVKAEVTCLGDSICFHLKVIQAFPKEKTLWVADYKEAKSQILNLNNRITKQIASEVKIELTADEDRILDNKQTVDPEAFEANVKGRAFLHKTNADALQKATEYFNLAIEKDPDWAPPYAGLAMVGAFQQQFNFITPSLAIPKIHENLNKALDLEPNSAYSHYVSAIVAVWTEWNWEKAEKEFIKSIELNPSYALCRAYYSHLLGILHREDESIQQANLAVKLDPFNPMNKSLTPAERSPQARMENAKKVLSNEPNHRLSKIQLSVAYRDMGEYEKWFELWKEVNRYDDEDIAEVDKVFQDRGYLAAVEKIIKLEEEKADEKQINICGVARRYLVLNNYDKAMDWFEKGYEIHHPCMPYIGKEDKLMDNPRYIELLKKMNLPLPED